MRLTVFWSVWEIPRLVGLALLSVASAGTAACSRRPDVPARAEVASGSGSLHYAAAPVAGRAGPANQNPGFALVELFTSEGCSSCPPADANLARIAGRDDVYALSFHVDYWDYLGWRDPWSDARWSARQNRYARVMRSSNVYTPQIVVNGVRQLLGSDAAATDQAIASALDTPALAKIDLSVRRGTDRHEIAASWRVDGAPADALLELAFVRAAASDHATRGENAGRELSHVNVVRALSTQTLDARGSGRKTLRVADADATRVVVWVQDARSLAVLGAAVSALE